MIWPAGVRASPLAAELAEGSGAEVGRRAAIGRARPYAAGSPRGLLDRRHGHAAGCTRHGPTGHPGGQVRSECVERRLKGQSSPRFRYRDLGSMATIGRTRAVADILGVKGGRLPRLADLGPRPPRLPDRLGEPGRNAHPLGMGARRAQSARAAHQRAEHRPEGGRPKPSLRLGVSAPGRGPPRADRRRLAGSEHERSARAAPCAEGMPSSGAAIRRWTSTTLASLALCGHLLRGLAEIARVAEQIPDGGALLGARRGRLARRGPAAAVSA